MSSPAISVLLPSNNLDNFFDIALTSVHADLPEDSEILVVLNGDAIRQSTLTDWSKYGIPNLRLLYSYEEGLVAALNLGIHEARGEFIARMDADDVILPGRLSQQLAFLRREPEYAAVGTQYVEICSHGREGLKSRLPGHLRSKPWPPLSTQIAHPTVMFRRETVEMVGGYRSDFLHAEDQDLWLRLLQVSRLGNLNNVYLKYRKHVNQVSVANAAEQQIGLIQTYLWNAGMGSCGGLLFQAQVPTEFKTLIRGSTRIGLKTKLILLVAVDYWGFSAKVGKFPRRFVTSGMKHPGMAIFFLSSNWRGLLRYFTRSGSCEDCVA